MSDASTTSSPSRRVPRRFTRLALWVFWTAALALLCAIALVPEIPGPRTTVLEYGELRTGSGESLGPVKLRFLAPGALGADTVRRLRLALPPKTSTGPEGLLVIAPIPNFRLLADDLELYATPAFGRSEDTRSSAGLRAHLIRLPERGLEAPRVELELAGHPMQGFGLVGVHHGPLDELEAAFKRRYYIQWVGVHVLIAVYLLAAVGALAFWNADRAYRSPGWFSGFCGFAAVAMAMGMATESPPVGWPLWLHAAIFVVGMASVFLAQFVFEKTGMRSRISDRSLIAMAVAIAVAGIVFYEDQVPFTYALMVDAACAALGCVLIGALALSLKRRFEALNAVLLAGVGVSLLFGLHSVAVGWWPDFEGSSYSLQFAPLPITLTMGWVVIARHARMRLRTEALNRRLARRVALRE